VRVVLFLTGLPSLVHAWHAQDAEMDEYFLKADPKKAAAKLDAELESYKAAKPAGEGKEGGKAGAPAAAPAEA
jgi:hypothetical protein